MHIMIQARSTSTRFPNKVMQKIGDKIILEHVLERTNTNCFWRHQVLLIPKNDPIAGLIEAYNGERLLSGFFIRLPCFEGSEHNVLDRFYQAAIAHSANSIVRITSDCPLLDVAMFKDMVTIFEHDNGLDFMTNLPCADGHDIEIMSFRALEWTKKGAKTKYDKEHVTTYIKTNRDKFEKAGFRFYRYKVPYLPEWYPKLSVDTPEDLERVREIYKRMEEQ